MEVLYLRMGKESTEAAELTDIKRLLGKCAEGKRMNMTVAAASHIEKCPACTSFHAQMCRKKQHGMSLWRSLGASNTWGGCYLPSVCFNG